MSLGVVIKGAEGVVLAADSRVTLGVQQESGPGFSVNFDNATKLLVFSKPHNFVGAVTYGLAVIGRRTANSFLPEFELNLKDEERLDVQEFAKRLSNFFMGRWQEAVQQQLVPADYSAPGMAFVVGGYDPDAAVDFWRRMSKQGGSKMPQFLSTHPSDEKRIKNIQKYLPEARIYYRNSKRKP